MSMQLVMGNEAIALGAIQAGVNVAAGYPGTPSTEIIETIAKNNGDRARYVEWSVNEKAGMEVAAGASYAGARSIVTMKQVGLNVASDPLMSLAYVGVKGGLVVVAADDPGPISSQTEQDTRHFAQFAKLPVFDPSSPEEAYEMVQAAFNLSEKYGTPVILRPTTRVCHGCTSMDIPAAPVPHKIEGFIKDTKRWVIFPRASYLNHIKIEKRNAGELNDEFSASEFNKIIALDSAKSSQKADGCRKIGIITGGISFEYTMESLADRKNDFASVLKIGTPNPFPEKKALEFLNSVDEVIAVEELDPVLEDALIFLCGKYHLNKIIHGKHDGTVQNAGENSVESIQKVLMSFTAGAAAEKESSASKNTADMTASMPDKMPGRMPGRMPPLPVRPPVLCAGCPHRGSFYAVKQAVKKYYAGNKAVFSGDIGCYTLGNAAPLDMCDTCLCMGADITIAQGLHRAESDSINFSFIGDSTFFASGMTGIVNAVYNQTPIVICVLDNSTTAMTGQQPHPGTGITMMGDVVAKVSIQKILEASGVASVETVNPFNLEEAESAVKKAVELSLKESAVTAVIFKSPCISVAAKLIKNGEIPAAGAPGSKKYAVSETKCKSCRKCINELGCPAVVVKNNKAFIEQSLCFGCSLCEQVCPFGAISESVSGTAGTCGVKNAGGAK